MFESVWYATSLQLLFYYGIQGVTLVYLFNKYKRSLFDILIILLFYPAIFAFLGNNFLNYYKIGILLFTIWISFRQGVFRSFKKGDRLIALYFMLFSLLYAISALTNEDSWSIILSQYSRYIIAFCLWFIVRQELFLKGRKLKKLNGLILDLFLMQIIITIGKLLIFQGRQIEHIVGSMSHTGGAVGTTIPILGFIALWVVRQRAFTFKDWLFVLGLMLIGFLAGKRAVWFIMPIIISGFMIYVPGYKLRRKIWAVIIIIPLIFYLGIRGTPTLNPENKTWGRFDLMYTYNYALAYQFGEGKNATIQGRGGATFFLWDNLLSNKMRDEEELLGRGFSSMYATDYEEFDELDLGLAHKGSATGVFQSYVTLGYIGVFLTVLFFFSMLWRTKMNRFRYILIAIVAWEYFFYTGMIFRTPAFMFIVIYFVHYSRYLAPIQNKIISHVHFKNYYSNNVKTRTNLYS